MTTAVLPRLAAPLPVPSSFVSFLTEIFEGISEGRAIAERHRLLSSLTTSELARFGLTRQDISRVAVTGF